MWRKVRAFFLRRIRGRYLCRWRSCCHCFECPYNTGVAK